MKFSNTGGEILKPFKAPIICGVFLFLGMLALIYGEKEASRVGHEQRTKAFGHGFHESCVLLVKQLTTNGIDRTKLSTFLDVFVAAARPLECIMLVDSNGVIIGSNGYPKTFSKDGLTGEKVYNEIFFMWSPLFRKHLDPMSKNADSSLSLISGFNFADSKFGERNFSHMFWKYSIMACAVLFAMCLWALTIHTRMLSARLAQEKIEKDHLNQLGLSAAGLAHETKNPLGIILGLSHRLSISEDATTQVQNMACQIMDSAENASSRLGEFIEYARLRDANIRAIDCESIIEKAVTVLNPDFEDRGIFLVSNADSIQIMCDKEMILQVLVNLLLNSLNASKEACTVTVVLKKNGSTAMLEVSDNGGGIDPELIMDVFKPYVSSTSKGHGLGLAIVKRVADCHNWELSLKSELHQGTTVTIRNIKIATKQEV